MRHWVQYSRLRRYPEEGIDPRVFIRCTMEKVWMERGQWLAFVGSTAGECLHFASLEQAMQAVEACGHEFCHCTPAQVLAAEIEEALEKENG